MGEPQGLVASARRTGLSASAVAGYVFGVGTQIKDAFVLAFEPPPIEGLSMTGGFDGFVQAPASGSLKALEAAVQGLVAAAVAAQGARQRHDHVTRPACRRFASTLDREKAKLLGINVADVFDTLQSTFGALYVNDFNRDGRVFRVHLQSEAEFRARPEDIRNVYVRAGDGTMVPLNALVDDPRGHRAGGHRALQRVPVGQGPGRRGAGLQLGRSAGRDGGGRATGAAGRLRARLDGHLVPGEGDGRQLDRRSSWSAC